MRSRLIRAVTPYFLCLCAATALSGCVDLSMYKAIREHQRQEEEQMRKLAEAEKQWQLGQIRGAQIVERAKQEELRVAKEQVVSGENNELEVTASPPPDAYGSNATATPIDFLRLPPEKKAALHWAAAQEYWRLHNTRMNYDGVEILARLHGTRADSILKSIDYWNIPKEKIIEFMYALPYDPWAYEMWRADTFRKYRPFDVRTNDVNRAVVAFEQTQKEEQLNPSLNRHGCEWVTGKYYIDRNPSSLCTQKTESIAQMKNTEQVISKENNEPDDPETRDAYGSNVAATPIAFVSLPPEKKAALHWAAAQEYRNLHNTDLNQREAIIVAELHGTTTDQILKTLYYSNMPREQSFDIIHALPHRPKSYEKWRATTIEKYLPTKELNIAVAKLDQAQKDEQLKQVLTPKRHGCEWMTGKYYIDRNPSSLCTPVIGACIEGDCNNGLGTYVSFDGTKFVGGFEQGRATKRYISGTCLQGNCTNGHGTYAFSDGSKYVGDFKNGRPNGKGTKTWAIGFSYTGEFKDGRDIGKGKYTPPARRNLSQATCLEGDCNNGQGTIMYENDTKYIGQFTYGQPHGKGIYYWRTGEALDGWFRNGWLEKGENHISPDGSITVEDQERSWRKTYAEEEYDVRWDYVMKHKEEIFIEGMVQVIEADRKAKEEYCGERYHREGTSDYYYCGK